MVYNSEYLLLKAENHLLCVFVNHIILLPPPHFIKFISQYMILFVLLTFVQL